MCVLLFTFDDIYTLLCVCVCVISMAAILRERERYSPDIKSRKVRFSISFPSFFLSTIYRVLYYACVLGIY